MTTTYPATTKNIEHAAALLKAGELVAFPTETVYGLGADATNDKAVAAIFAAKERPQFNPLIIHAPSRSDLSGVVDFDERAELLAQKFWPGGLTLILPRAENSAISLLASAGLPTLAVRVPSHPIARKLLAQAACPIAAPSANISGSISPTSAAHVAQSLGDRPAMILDGGSCMVGVESTIIDLSSAQPTILRHGAITAEELRKVIGDLSDSYESKEIKAPGQMSSHYAPSAPLRMNVTEAKDNEALLCFGPTHLKGLNLSERGDVTGAASNLFAMLYQLDNMEVSGIAVMTIPDKGLGIAINDRLRRAAAPRTKG